MKSIVFHENTKLSIYKPRKGKIRKLNPKCVEHKLQLVYRPRSLAVYKSDITSSLTANI